MADLDTLARQLGRARTAYETRSDDERAYKVFIEAENAYLKAQARLLVAERKAALARMAHALDRARRIEVLTRRQIGAVWDEVRKLKKTVKRGRRHSARAKEVLTDMFGGGID